MCDFALSCYKEVINADNFMKVGETILVPKFNEKILEKIIQMAINNLEKEKPLIKRNGNYIIVGDIHGNLHDLLRIFRLYGYPPAQKYIFLGDYVDRGEFSIDVITMLLVLYNSYPDNITLIRGNHEFTEINSVYGFQAECMERFGDNGIFKLFNEAFEFLPIACILNEEVFLRSWGYNTKNQVN